MFSMYGRIYPIDYVSLKKVMYRAYSNIEVWRVTAAWFNLVFVVLFFINLYWTFVQNVLPVSKALYIFHNIPRCAHTYLKYF
jgi:hypothetical protein